MYARGQDYSYIIIDPLYKVLVGLDENSAGDIGRAVTYFDALAQETGAAVITTLHFSKGSAFSKSQMAVTDRASGSGVFGRDPDAICTLLQLAWDPVAMNRPNTDETAWRASFVLREFRDPGERNIFFDYPVHIVDTVGLLKEAPFVGTPQIAGGKTRGAALAAGRQETILNIARSLHTHLRTPGGRCEMVDGKRAINRAAIENELGLGQKSIYRYLENRTLEDPENGERYVLQGGKFFVDEGDDET